MTNVFGDIIKDFNETESRTIVSKEFSGTQQPVIAESSMIVDILTGEVLNVSSYYYLKGSGDIYSCQTYADALKDAEKLAASQTPDT